jgi:hypothetical protein
MVLLGDTVYKVPFDKEKESKEYILHTDSYRSLKRRALIGEGRAPRSVHDGKVMLPMIVVDSRIPVRPVRRGSKP